MLISPASLRKLEWTSRRWVLDAPMLVRALAPRPSRALDVGCGEGRFCRMLQNHGVDTVGIDPTPALLARAKALDPAGDYREGRGETLEFEDACFDLVVSYLTLIGLWGGMLFEAERDRAAAREDGRPPSA